MRIAPEYSINQKHVFNWLMTGCILILLMVVIGGITRLTQSGLSMVKWEPLMGSLPPLSVEEWNETFDLYKKSPEFKHYNSHFTLSDFKSIFFWEYLHRLIGRIIGLVFLIPCILFWRKGSFSKKLKKQVLIIFAWGAFQGILGWVMVKSGLVDNPHVSHYRLAAHLITAIGLMAYLFWTALSVKYIVEKRDEQEQKKLNRYLKGFIFLVFIQLIYGALVAGLKAGYGYNTFPKMGDNWIPPEFATTLSESGIMALFENPWIVQFIHRIFAYLIVIIVVLLWFKGGKTKWSPIQHKFRITLTTFTALQFTLGVITILLIVPVSIGVIHQFGAILLLFSAILFLFSTEKRENRI